MTNDHINVRNVYIELLNKLKTVEGVDIQYIDHLVDLLNQDIYLVETDVQWIESLIPAGASSEDQLVKHSDLPSFTQVNSDWNATSGVAEILNKPTIPAAQVNSDWNATSGVAQILNKPTIPAAQSTYKTEEITLQGPWYGPLSGLYYWEIYINDRIDETKNWTINLIPGNSSDIAPTSTEASMYNALKGATVDQDSMNQIKLTLYSTIDPTSAYVIQFNYWSLP